MMRLWNSFSMRSSRAVSWLDNEVTGKPDHMLTTVAMSSSVTTVRSRLISGVALSSPVGDGSRQLEILVRAVGRRLLYSG